MNIYKSLSSLSSLMQAKAEDLAMQTKVGKERAIAKAKEDLRSRLDVHGDALLKQHEAKLAVAGAEDAFNMQISQRAEALMLLDAEYDERRKALEERFIQRRLVLNDLQEVFLKERRLAVQDAEAVLAQASRELQQAEDHLDSFGDSK